MTKVRVDPRQLPAVRPARLGTADVVEAVYRGGDPALRHFVGRPAVWMVLGHHDAVARLAPYPLPLGFPAHGRVTSAPQTDFEAVQRIAKLADGG